MEDNIIIQDNAQAIKYLMEGDFYMVKENVQIKEHNRLIPSRVKAEVWKRDKGQCVQCGSKDHLHFDHILPFSKGGTSIDVKNIQILCARHNLQKSDKII